MRFIQKRLGVSRFNLASDLFRDPSVWSAMTDEYQTLCLAYIPGLELLGNIGAFCVGSFHQVVAAFREKLRQQLCASFY